MQCFSLTKTATTLGISLGLIVGSASQILAFTFNLNRSFDGGTAIGTITTDQLGTLNSTNITNWSIQISRGADTRLLTENDSVLNVGDLAPTIFATATELTITPATEAELISAGATESRLGFIDGGFSGQFYDYESSIFMGDFFSLFEGIRLSPSNQAFNPSTPTSLSLPAQVTPPSVPEPTTILGLLAFSSIGALATRKKGQ